MTDGASTGRCRRYFWIYVVLLCGVLIQFAASDDLSFGRRPWENLKRTAVEFSWPSFLNVWYGDPQLEFRSDEGTLLRVENERESEVRFLKGLVDAVWVTFKIATLGSFIAAMLALPFAFAPDARRTRTALGGAAVNARACAGPRVPSSAFPDPHSRGPRRSANRRPGV